MRMHNVIQLYVCVYHNDSHDDHSKSTDNDDEDVPPQQAGGGGGLSGLFNQAAGELARGYQGLVAIVNDQHVVVELCRSKRRVSLS